jgi:hypothetical protein
MAFTNVTIVSKHLAEFKRTLRSVENQIFHLSGEEFIELPHKGITQSSEIVKGKELNQPVYEKVTLDDGQVSLNKSEIIPESVVVARDQSLSVIYNENIDYTVDYKSGLISRTENGGIVSGQEVSVWYFTYTVYARNNDYVFDYKSGKIKRLTEGAVENGQVVWIDYEIEAGSFSDDMIQQAVEEAHTYVEMQISEEFLDSSDNILEVAETYIALDILARMKGLEVLQSEFVGSSQRSSVSTDYIMMGRSYREQADKILERYSNPEDSLASPRKIRNKS